MHIYLAGMPLTLGGANQEAGDTVLLWRRNGIEVTVLTFRQCHCGKPCTKTTQDNPWTERLHRAGVKFDTIESGFIGDVLKPNDIVVSFCVGHTLHNWPEMAGCGVKLIWSPCMCYVVKAEMEAFRCVPPTFVHFQSRYQAQVLCPQYKDWGCHNQVLIHGAFEPLPYCSPPRRDAFIVGRIARPCRTKWHPAIWKVLEEARKSVPDLIALMLGWDDVVEAHCGPPPDWAWCMKPDSMMPDQFYRRVHAIVCPDWGVQENWPRVGLEAMSCGVPLVVDDAGGWREMLGPAGILCGTLGQYAEALVKLGTDEQERRRLIAAGLERVAFIADPERIMRKWREVFEAAEMSKSCFVWED